MFDRAAGAPMLSRAGMVGPVAFIAAWLTGGLITSVDYSPIDDAISRLAAVDADTRWLMSAGFVVFGVCLPLFGFALRNALTGWAWLAAVVTGLATLGVAATPLDASDTIDTLHGLFATVGYIALVAIPLLAYRSLREQHVELARAGLAAAAISSVALVLTLSDLPTGLFQRAGLTSTDLWLIALAWHLSQPPDRDRDSEPVRS